MNRRALAGVSILAAVAALAVVAISYWVRADRATIEVPILRYSTADADTLIVTYLGDRDSRLERVDVDETESSVSLVAVANATSGERSDADVGREGTTEVDLSRPLGSRIVLDSQGQPVPLVPADVASR